MKVTKLITGLFFSALTVALLCAVISEAVETADDFGPKVPSNCTTGTSDKPVTSIAGNTVIGHFQTENVLGEFEGGSVNNLILSTSGSIYLFPEPVPHDGTMLQVTLFGYYSQESLEWMNSNPNTNFEAYVYVVVFRHDTESRSYELVHLPEEHVHGASSPASFDVSLTVQKGDLIGALIPSSCINRTASSGVCPSQVNLRTDRWDCSSALYSPFDTDEGFDGWLINIDEDDLMEVQVNLNMEFVISPTGESKDLQQLVYMVPAAVVGSLLGALGVVCILWCFWMSRRSRKFPGTFSKHGVGGADGKNCESTDHTYEDMDRKGRSDSSLEQSMKFKLAAIDTHVPITSSLSGSDVMATASSERPHQPLKGHTSDKTPSEACTSSNQLPVDVPDGYSLLGKETPEVEINNNNVSKSDDGYVGDEYVGDESVGDNQYEMDNYEYVCPEPYFEPANEEETLVMQLNTKLAMTEIRREDLEFGAILGSGEFGTVYRGVWSHCKADSNQIVKEEVAVKTIEHQYSEKDKVKFLQEAAIMAQFKHDNIVGIKGVLTKPPTMMIVLDLLEGGDLRQYLLTTMRSRLSSLDPAELGSMLLSYMRQISVGLLCLIMKSYIHRDLAARNILVSKDGTVCKIADFGLSRDLHMESSYVSHGGKVPVKWTAPEAIHYRKYSPASDVWSLGCVMYEIWSLGHKPFQEQSNSEAMKYIASGRRLHPPPGCPKAVYNIMIKCWNPTPDERPLICRLIQELQRSDFQLLKWSADDVNVYSKNTRTIGAPLNLGKELFEELQNTYLK